MARDVSFFTTIKEKVPLEDYLSDHLGVELVGDGGGRQKALCPFHEENTPSFSVSDSDDGDWRRWWCFGACQTGGSVIDAVMKAEGFELAHEAAEFLNDLYDLGLEMDSEGYKRFRKTIKETEADIRRTKEEMEDPQSKAAAAAKKYLAKRGFSEETISHFQLAVDTERTKQGRLSIPLIDKANHPVSIANRALFDSHPCQACGVEVSGKEMRKRQFQAQKAEAKGEKLDFDWRSCPECGAPSEKAKLSWLVRQHPKYLFVRDFDKANLLYNENAARKVLSKQKDAAGLFLVEGYADVWAGWQSGHEAICSYNGAVLSEWQAAEAVELAQRAEKPIILVPDFDETGRYNIEPNISKLRSSDPSVEIQVVYGVDKLTYMERGEEKRCKDLGDVIKNYGPEKVHEILDQNRWAAAEWQIREICETKNARTGEPFHSEERQMQLVAEVLSAETAKIAIDHLIDYLAKTWGKKVETIRDWFYSNLSADNVTTYKHLYKDIHQAREESHEFLLDDNIIPLGFKGVDESMPGGGARPGQLALVLGKSGTGKAQPLDSKLLTPSGWIRMGDVSLGQLIVDPITGGSSKVIGIHPQDGDREIFRVEFSDGSSAECDLEHLWPVMSSPDSSDWEALTLREIAPDGRLSGRWFIPAGNPPIEFARVPEPAVDPEAVGIALGSGEIGRVPTEILTASVSARIALLRGAMSSAGSLRGGEPLPIAELTVKSERVASDLAFVIRSLGGIAVIRSEGESVTVEAHTPADLIPFPDGRVEASAWRGPAVTAREIVSVERLGERPAQCVSLDSESQLYYTDDLIVTHNTMLATQLISNMADHGIRSVFFSLEQAPKSLFPRLVCQALDVSNDEAEELIRASTEDERVQKKLQPVWDTYENMMLIDNVPTATSQAIAMTPSTIQAIIQNLNMTRFQDHPVQVVIIDHMAILEVDDDAPREIKASELAQPGYVMKKLFAVAKATNVFMLVLQQLPKEIPPGVPFGYDAGRGGSQQTDFCDYIFQIWRPEQQQDLDENEKLKVLGQYKFALGKNRYGRDWVEHLHFDRSTLRILPDLQITQPAFVNPNGPVIDVDDGSASEEIRVSGSGADAASLGALSDETDTSPTDSKAISDELIGEELESEENFDAWWED